MKTRLQLLSASLLALACNQPLLAANDDAASIRQLLSATWDKADAKVETGPLVIQQDYAVADWKQGARGGRALLTRHQGRWQVTVCAGRQLRDAAALREAGAPAALAERLAAALAQEEQKLPASDIARFDSFGALQQHSAAHEAGSHTNHAAHAVPAAPAAAAAASAAGHAQGAAK